MSESIYFWGTNCCRICGNSVDKYDRDAHQEWHERQKGCFISQSLRNAEKRFGIKFFADAD